MNTIETSLRYNVTKLLPLACLAETYLLRLYTMFTEVLRCRLQTNDYAKADNKGIEAKLN